MYLATYQYCHFFCHISSVKTFKTPLESIMTSLKLTVAMQVHTENSVNNKCIIQSPNTVHDKLHKHNIITVTNLQQLVWVHF